MLFFSRASVRLQNLKEPAFLRPIERMEPSDIAIIPLSHGKGRVLECHVPPGRSLPKFTVLAHPSNDTYDDCAMLMPMSGRLLEIKEYAHPLLGRVPAAVVEYDKSLNPRATVSSDVSLLTQDELLSLARMSCIVDSLDGVCLYTKLYEYKDKRFDTLVVDCIEDQPYSSALLRLLIERGDQIAQGALFALRAMGARRVNVVIASNSRVKLKKEYKSVSLMKLKGGYPLREKLAAKLKKKSFITIGGAALADFYHALTYGQGQTSCIVTVAGDCVKNPVNLEVPIGTPVYAVLRHCGLCAEPGAVILGDVMTGVAVTDLTVPVIPKVRTLLAISQDKVKSVNCIGCGRCVKVCHKGLMPYAIYNSIERDDKSETANLKIEDCDLCGACSFVCPSKIELARSFALVNN